MNDTTKQNTDTNRDDKAMARLLRFGGARLPVPDAIEARVYARVRKEWRASSKLPDSARVYSQVHRQWAKTRPRPPLRRWALPAALAAAVIMTIAVVMQPPPPMPANIPVGTVVRVVAGDHPGALPELGRQIFAGEQLTTGSGQGLSVTLSQAGSLRVGENTTLVVESRDEFRLLEGHVYADTGDFVYRSNGLVIHTLIGSVTDVGTQFAVTTGGDRLDVAVREGRVDVAREAEQFVAVAGERMVFGSEGSPSVGVIEPNDAYWNWASSLAPAFDIENKSLLDFLRWAARETGLELDFETDELRMSAMRTDLHGSVVDFEPLQAIESIMATTKFSYRIEADRIVIKR